MTNPTNVLINFVLDKSGSMSSLANATIEGFNSFVAEQSQGEGIVLLSLTLFDTTFDVRFVAHELDAVPALGSNQNRYSPNGGTALYDAVATTIKGTEAWLSHHRDFTGDVVTVIMTDGEENSSKTTTLGQVNELITQKTSQGWEFIFLGSGKAAWTEGTKFTSIPHSARFAGAGSAASTKDNYTTAARAMTRKRRTGERYDQSLRGEGMEDANRS